MKDFTTDLRFAWRSLWKNPALTAIAVAALALGIGANTAIFSVVYGVLLKTLPFPDPGRVIRLVDSNPSASPAAVLDRSSGFCRLAGSEQGLLAPRGEQPRQFEFDRRRRA